MAVITLVCRANVRDALNNLTRAEDGGDTFTAALATQANPTVAVAYWVQWDTLAYGDQPERPKQNGEWNLHRLLAAHPDIGPQIAAQDGWTDGRMEFRNPTTNNIVLLAYRNKTPAQIRNDINATFGVTLQPLEVLV